jgi:hypothetical protein
MRLLGLEERRAEGRVVNEAGPREQVSTEMCRKSRFATERDAWRRMMEITFASPARYPGPKPCRAYRCPTCGDWHLTRRVA